MKKAFIISMVSLCIFANTAAAKSVTDSLVNNLSCSSLSVDSILKKIRPNAFAATHHLPIQNWGFRSGLANLAACWGMSSTQRKLFYLMRLNEKAAPPVDTQGVFDIFRGASLEYVTDPNQIVSDRVNEVTLKNYKVIPVTEDNVAEEYRRNNGNGFLETLKRGITQNVGPLKVQRNFKTEIERSQELHFFRPGNIGMGIGSGPLHPSQNEKTLRILLRNIDSNRLSLINLRLTMTSQHIVIPKSYVKDDKENVWIKVYDSNQPDMDQTLLYSKERGHFYSAQIMGRYMNDYTGTDFSHPLGVFIVDEKERVYLEESLLRHYRKICEI